MKKGFTLIELLVVIGVMAVIAAGVVATINPQQKLLQARDSQSQNGVGQVAGALQAFAAAEAQGRYPLAGSWQTDLVPTELQALPALPSCGAGACAFTYQVNAARDAASLSVPMQATKNTTIGALWCWRSAAGASVLAAACAP
jgi:prepilin-type N-terminal cleavage/methylation domain-containing protein